MLATALTLAALDCAACAAGVAQLAHAARVEGVIVLVIAGALLVVGAGLLALAKVA